tara:strand:- start:57 stop:566 length:510 start_codon:yes stop_codon:yes gene_type:complete
MQKVMSLHEIMTRSVYSVYPDTSITEAIRLLLNHHVSGAPVVEAHPCGDKLIGMLSEKDCLGVLTTGAYYDMPEYYVRDYMTKEVIKANPDMDLFAAADLFMKNNLRRLPIVDDKGYLIGIVTRRDVLNASRSLWDRDIPAQDPGYLTEAVKAKLGRQGRVNLHKTQRF